MTHVIRIIGLNDGQPTPYDGKYLSKYDPDEPGHDPDGNPMWATVEVVEDKAKALHFRSAGDAMDLYRRICKPPREFRADGRPNRPLTAFTVDIQRLAIEHDLRDYLGFRDLPDGRHLDVMPLTFDRARLAVSSTNEHSGIDESYDYLTTLDALTALRIWDGNGEPPGWVRAATPDIEPSGFRRRSDPGDPNSEEVRR
jgi:hypothetical protein